MDRSPMSISDASSPLLSEEHRLLTGHHIPASWQSEKGSRNMTRRIINLITPRLAFCCFCLCIADMSYGYDAHSIGGILVIPGFVNRFGSLDPQGVYKIPKVRKSLLTSLAYIGKLLGTLTSAPITERYGHRVAFVIFAIATLVGVAIEMSANQTRGGSAVALFLVGRIVVYYSNGLVELCVTTYQSEIVPAPLRGLVVTSLQLFLNLGALIGTIVNRAVQDRTDDSGWQIVTAVQFTFPAFLVFCIPWLPDSPRWLISKDRPGDAIESLRKVRTRQDVDFGKCEEEIMAIQEALQVHVHKEPWSSLFRGTNLRRTIIVLMIYTYAQSTGQSFSGVYSTTFYHDYGFEKEAFTYPIITSALNVVFGVLAMLFVDHFGDIHSRRFILMTGYLGQGFFLFMLAGLGGWKDPTTGSKNTMVASFILFSQFYNLGGAPVKYVIGAEVPNAAVREKTDSLGASINVCLSIAVNFLIPFMLDSIGVKTAWVFGSIAFSAVFYTFFFVPETKGLALEEIDALFEKPYNPFKKREITANPAAVRVAILEGELRPAVMDGQEEQDVDGGKMNPVDDGWENVNRLPVSSVRDRDTTYV